MRWKLHGIELSPFYTTAWPGERSVKMLRQDILQWQQTVLARQADQPILLTFRVRSTYSVHAGSLTSSIICPHVSYTVCDNLSFEKARMKNHRQN